MQAAMADEAVQTFRQEAPLLLRAEEVARLLGISRSKAFALLATNELPAIRIGRSVRVARADLEAWIQSRAARAA